MGFFTAGQLEDFRRDGFVAVPEFFAPAEVAALQAEFERLHEEGMLRNVHTEGDGATQSRERFNLQCCPCGQHSRLIRSLPFAGRVATAVAQLLGTGFRQRLDQIFFKPAGTGVGTRWHQDNDYFAEARGDAAWRGVGMWIALHDADVASGTMHVIPGVHREVFRHRRDPGSDHHVTCADAVDEARAVPIEVPAGGVLFFNYGVPHCTRANRSDRDRAGLALHFQDLDLVPEQAMRHGFPTIRGPGADGGVAVWGEDLRGVFDELIAIGVAGPG